MKTPAWRGWTAALACVVLLGAACTKSGSTNGGQGSGSPASSSPTMQATTASEAPSDTGSPQPSIDLSGTWQGTWANSTPDTSTGTFVVTWHQNGADLQGTITIAGTPCLDGGSVTGTLRGTDSINFGVVSGQVEVNYAGTVSGDAMSGTYATTCGNAEGDWQATRA